MFNHRRRGAASDAIVASPSHEAVSDTTGGRKNEDAAADGSIANPVSTTAILTALTLRAMFRLALRQTEGLIGDKLHYDKR